jgi:hypothetical protein
MNSETTKAQRITKPVGPRLLPLKEAAERLGLTVWSMRERIWAGFVRFPGGRKIFIDIKDLDKFVERNKTTLN